MLDALSKNTLQKSKEMVVLNSEEENNTYKMEQDAEVNGFVYRYLTGVSARVAKLFKRECKTEVVVDPSSPTINEVIKSYNAGQKRKLNESANATPAKKAKAANGKAKKDESEDSSDDSESEDEAPKTNGKGKCLL